jgi:hypothetical protein
MVRRTAEPVVDEPGYASPAPWSVRAMLTLYGLMLLLNFPVAAIAMKLDSTLSYWESLLSPSVFLYLLYALLTMPFAQRLAHQPRRLRPLETLAAAALMYVVYDVAVHIALQAMPGGVSARNPGQMASLSIAAVLGGAAGAVLYPLAFRRLWMPRLPSARRGPRR